MTESTSQTQLVEDTNRFGKHKGKSNYVNSRSLPSNMNSNGINGANGTNGTSSNMYVAIRSQSASPSSNSLSSLSSSSSPSSSASASIYTVVFQPLNSQFPVKTIEVSANTRCRIGRQSNAKTIPKPLNGYFDSKVLSRNHALMWSGIEGGGVWIRDTKSSNGTFLNGQRLSAELEESEPFELKTGDKIEFGIDITGEDGSVLYHKVACNVSIFNIPVDQMEHSTLKEFNLANGYASLFSTSEMEASHQRRGSTSSISTISYQSGKTTITDHSTVAVAKRNKNWEILLSKLEGELQRSQQVEKELLGMKDAIGEMDKANHEERLKKSNALNKALQKQLDDAHHQVNAYAEKSRLQDLSLSSAQKELMELRQRIDKITKNNKMNGSEVASWRQKVEQVRLELETEKLKHNKDLMMEKKRCVEYEQKCVELEKHLLTLERGYQRSTSKSSEASSSNQGGLFSGFMDAIQIRSVQVILGVMMAVISTLLYALLLVI
ncbi:hypothetical protein BCR42DRAFT_61057 [Absidia repens]|uniref:FHA domain-containing protein n=1 Tax=Absidia repens TaxID=90262 RepID=A0A1X2ICN7_9FUNG|nr:hypothetical protein BCR42DRAFT_61057 [Absidia repens]